MADALLSIPVVELGVAGNGLLSLAKTLPPLTVIDELEKLVLDVRHGGLWSVPDLLPSKVFIDLVVVGGRLWLAAEMLLSPGVIDGSAERVLYWVG